MRNRCLIDTRPSRRHSPQRAGMHSVAAARLDPMNWVLAGLVQEVGGGRRPRGGNRQASKGWDLTLFGLPLCPNNRDSPNDEKERNKNSPELPGRNRSHRGPQHSRETEERDQLSRRHHRLQTKRLHVTPKSVHRNPTADERFSSLQMRQQLFERRRRRGPHQFINHHLGRGDHCARGAHALQPDLPVPLRPRTDRV